MVDSDSDQFSLQKRLHRAKQAHCVVLCSVHMPRLHAVPVSRRKSEIYAVLKLNAIKEEQGRRKRL